MDLAPQSWSFVITEEQNLLNFVTKLISKMLLKEINEANYFI